MNSNQRKYIDQAPSNNTEIYRRLCTLWMNGQMDRLLDGQIDEQTDRQIAMAISNLMNYDQYSKFLQTNLNQ